MKEQMKQSRGLGKGLDSMIAPKKEATTGKNEKIVKTEIQVNINDIEPNSEQPRKKFDEDSLSELAESIKQYGIIEPLIVQKKGKRYEIIAGERRWRAARIAELSEVPVVVKEYTPQEIMEIALIENIQRQDLNPIEEANAYRRLIEDYNLKQDELAKRVSKNRSTITNALRLLKLSEHVQQLLIEDIISSGHARALLGITDSEKQNEVATRILDEKLSVRETEKLVKSINSNRPKKEKKMERIDEARQATFRDIEERMKEVFGTKVNINDKGSKGKIEIEYYSEDELDRIYDLLMKLRK